MGFCSGGVGLPELSGCDIKSFSKDRAAVAAQGNKRAPFWRYLGPVGMLLRVLGR